MGTKMTILIKTDKDVKASIQRTAQAIGISLGTVMGMFLRKFANEQWIEFEAPLLPNVRTD